MISCIVAVEKNQGIGFEGQIPWPRLKGDMSWFKNTTSNSVVIMGRKTWESIGSKKLPNRVNIVLSRNKIEGSDLSLTVPDSCLDVAKVLYPKKEIFIIGGGNVYKHFMNIIDRFYITEINESYQCDTFFDLNYVQTNFTKVIEHATFTEPVNYKIKEYNL